MNRLTKTLATLYVYSGRYKEALHVYLHLKSDKAFELIDNHNLIEGIYIYIYTYIHTYMNVLLMF